MAPPLISASRLVRRFGTVAALDGVDLAVDAGEVLLLLGANGAGKTTLIRLLAGLVRPHRGEVLIGGRIPARDLEARRRIGFLSHAAMLYEDLTPRENLAFTAALHQLDDPARSI
ncbi:MAG TPA: ATP-binding cassette domain-containing protein, partial [Gemmatimonadales bacterium]|nr:ATP-binding cassette domain-containing protein [Gemmatimonadales bacterium]